MGSNGGAGNEVQAGSSACMPPVVTLQCLPVAWLPGGLLELEITGKLVLLPASATNSLHLDRVFSISVASVISIQLPFCPLIEKPADVLPIS
jgi:hypothetical protein